MQSVTQTVPSLWVSTQSSDYPGDALAGIRLQRELESAAYVLGGENTWCPCTENRWLPERSRSSEIGEVKTIVHAGYPPNGYFKSTAWFCYRRFVWSNPSVPRRRSRFLYARRSTNRCWDSKYVFSCLHQTWQRLHQASTTRLLPARWRCRLHEVVVYRWYIDGIKAAEALALSMVGTEPSWEEDWDPLRLSVCLSKSDNS